jgi:hypothetical protein
VEAEVMTDKERILLDLVATLCEPDYSGKRQGFAHVSIDKPIVGDLAICQTSGRFNPHPFVVGYVHEIHASDDCTIRDIASDKLCRISNEHFLPIRNFSPMRLFVGKQRRFYIKIRKAMKSINKWAYRLGEVRIDGDTCIVSIREVFGGLRVNRRCIPFDVQFSWNGKTTIKQIAAFLVGGGVGTRRFEYEERK